MDKCFPGLRTQLWLPVAGGWSCHVRHAATLPCALACHLRSRPNQQTGVQRCGREASRKQASDRAHTQPHERAHREQCGCRV
jgi:hypothetical protein